MALTDGHKLSVKSANLEVAPTAQSSSLPTTHVHQETIQLEDVDFQHLFDFVYDVAIGDWTVALRTGGRRMARRRYL